MKKFVIISFFFCFLTGGLLIFNRLKIDMIPKAHSQEGAVGKTAPPVPAPANKAQVPPPPPEPQKALPTDINVGGPNPPAHPEEDLPPAAAPTPQDLDPSLKFVNSEGFIYDPTGRRDPFHSFISSGKRDLPTQQGPKTSAIPNFLRASDDRSGDSLESYELGQLTLVGILWEVHDPKAMVSTPSHKVFMVHNHTRIGKNNGYIAAIREGEVVVVEISPDGKTPSTRVLSLPN